MKSWTDQVAAVLPRARVEALRTLGDLSRDADVYLLSRETAKLGHAYRGVGGPCPRCGRTSDASAADRAARRLRCTAVDRRPVDPVARLAEALATIIAPALPEDARVRTALRGRALVDRLSDTPRPLAFRPLHAFLDSLLGEFRSTALRPDAPSRLFGNLLRTLPRLAAALDASARILDSLRDLTFRSGLPEDREIPIRNAIAGLLHARRDPEAQTQSPQSLLFEVLEILLAEGTWRDGEVCDEPLYQAEPTPRRYPLAKYILRQHASDFDLLVVDEAHEFNHAHSAQAHAAHRLCRLSGVPTIVLTGSLMGGYASSLFANFQALSPLFRDEFSREDLPSFLATYGYRKALRRLDDEDRPRRRGRNTDRDLDGRKILGEAPGVHPTFILRHLLPTAVLVHKSDLDEELPPLAEIPVPLAIPADDEVAGDLLAEYERLRDRLLDRIKADRFVKNRAGRLLGALVELPSYLDRATDDLEPFCLRYPESLGRELIDCGRSFPATWRTPKERWLEEELRDALRRGERVLVFLRHSGTAALPERLLALAREVSPRVAWLDAGRVSAPKREAWIDRHVLGQGVEILFVNPNAVRTGLNNLVSFSTALWYELDYSATTYRQANGRLHRIGQLRPVTVKTAYYRGTAQEIAFELVAKKVTASLQVDGLDIQAALEAAGAGADQAAARAAAMSLGQAVYRALTGEALQPSGRG